MEETQRDSRLPLVLTLLLVLGAVGVFYGQNAVQELSSAVTRGEKFRSERYGYSFSYPIKLHLAVSPAENFVVLSTDPEVTVPPKGDLDALTQDDLLITLMLTERVQYPDLKTWVETFVLYAETTTSDRLVSKEDTEIGGVPAIELVFNHPIDTERSQFRRHINFLAGGRGYAITVLPADSAHAEVEEAVLESFEVGD
ncbi:MAG: hypothetical protein Q7R81_03245 [Candidatus Peregrinibacteria bacterium]|nr:hypothetical protein [Candidatus Peregrinibacteria bacterium]